MYNLCLATFFLADVDECRTTDELRHRCKQECVNTVGSYTCACGKGHILAPDLLSCDGKWPMEM